MSSRQRDGMHAGSPMYEAMRSALDDALNERDRARNYLRMIRACCGYTVPGAEFGVETAELEGVMRVVDEYLRALAGEAGRVAP